MGRKGVKNISLSQSDGLIGFSYQLYGDNVRMYVPIPIISNARADLGFCIPSMLKRRTHIVHVEYGPRGPLKTGDSWYRVAESSIIVWRLAAAAVALSTSACEIRMLICRLSWAWECAAIASYCSFCASCRFSAFASELCNVTSKFRKRCFS